MVGANPAQNPVPTALPQIMHDPKTNSTISVRQTVIIFDWDDTLMASSWIDRMKLLQTEEFDQLPCFVQQQFRVLSEHAERCLTAASKFGRVIIITNAEHGWVEYSTRRFMPRLLPFIETMHVVSARTSYEKFYPSAPLCWKAAAFAHEANQLFGTLRNPGGHVHREIISFGDSNEERTAVKIAARQLGALSKSIKFVDMPSPEQLSKQVETVTGWLDSLSKHPSELDLMLKASHLVALSSDESPVAPIPANYQAKETPPWRPPPMATLDAPA